MRKLQQRDKRKGSTDTAKAKKTRGNIRIKKTLEHKLVLL